MASQTKSFSSSSADYYRPDATNALTSGENLSANDGSFSAWADQNEVNSRAEFHNFGFDAMGDGDTIDGIEVIVHHADSFGDNGPAVKVDLSFDGGTENSGTFTSTNYTATISTGDTSQQSDTLPSSGGSTAKWGETAISATDIKSSSNFRVRLAYVGDGFPGEHDIDHVEVTVYYTPSGGGRTTKKTDDRDWETGGTKNMKPKY